MAHRCSVLARTANTYRSLIWPIRHSYDREQPFLILITVKESKGADLIVRTKSRMDERLKELRKLKKFW